MVIVNLDKPHTLTLYPTDQCNSPGLVGGITSYCVMERSKHSNPKLAMAPTLWVCKIFIEPWNMCAWTWEDFLPHARPKV